MREISVGRNLVDNTLTTLYTVPAQQIAKWHTAFAHNASGSTKHFSLWWYDKSANTEIIVVLEYTLASKTYFQLDGSSYVCLEEGDEIRVKSETGSTVSVIVTVDQSYRQTTQHGF